jgi:hypothetical protein
MNKRFNKQAYIDRVYNYAPNRRENARNSERGFSMFIAEVLDRIDDLTSTKLSVLEIGISGGGGHVCFINALRNSVVYGIEWFDKNGREFYNSTGKHNYIRDNFDEMCIDMQQGEDNLHKQIRLQDNINELKLWYALDGYTQEAADKVYDFNNGAIDFIVDDGNPSGPETLMREWKDKVSDNGMIFSGNMFGQGIKVAYDKHQTPSWVEDNLKLISAEGWIAFDMKEYEVLAEPTLTEYRLNYMYIYAKNYNQFEEILTKYEHNIIAGKDNWKNDYE